MTCSACAANVEKAIRKVPGVASASVNLLLNSAEVDGSFSTNEVVASIRAAGYDVDESDFRSDKANAKSNEDDAYDDNAETLGILRRLISSALLLVLLLCFSMFEPLIRILPFPMNSPGSLGLTQLIIAFAIIAINKKIFVPIFWT